MKVPVLARILDEKDADGAMRDVQLRAALDLAIRDLDGGKYSVGLYPTVYNNLLAQLGGKSKTETLLTVREASGSLYTQAQGEDPSMKAAAEIRKFAAEIAAQHPGLAFDLTNLAFRVAEQEQEQQGQGKDKKKEDNKPDFLKDKDAVCEVRRRPWCGHSYRRAEPRRSDRPAPRAPDAQAGLSVTLSSPERSPRRSVMPMPKFAAQDADNILTRLDKVAWCDPGQLRQVGDGLRDRPRDRPRPGQDRRRDRACDVRQGVVHATPG